MSRIGILLVATGIFVAGCKDKQAEPSPAPPTPSAPVAASAAPSPVDSAPAPPAGATAAGKMAHCPSTVTGAKTDIKDVPNGVELTVSAADDAAVKEIRSRAAFLTQSAKTPAAGIQHNGSGEGSGVFGRCPVVMRDTAVVAVDVAGGTKLTVTTTVAKEQDWLRKETRTRNAELAMPGSEGAGVGKMAHCPNAVKGALTSVADAKDGVQITVTAKDDASVKEIRDRTTHIVAAAKNDPASVKHDGQGDGGGGLGRCPVVLKDTDVEAKDAPGGSVILVKPKKATDLKTLQKEVRERSAKFG